MKIIFFGMGSIGHRHAELIRKDYPYEIYAYRTQKGDSLYRKTPSAIKEIDAWKDVDLINPDVAFITNPTSLHLETAIECARRGMALFIEKPLDSQTKLLNRFLTLVKKNKLTTYVAYVLRFHPVIEALKKELKKGKFCHMRVWTGSYLPQWRKGIDHKKRYSANREMGGGRS